MSVKTLFNWSAPLIMAAALWLLSQYSFLLFHTIAELFTIAVAWSIFTIVWNARRMSDNSYFLVLGTGFLFIGVVDLLHVLAYKGMPIFHGYDANLPTQLWIAWQYLLAVSFCGAIACTNRQFNPNLVFLAFLSFTTLIVSLIFLGWFPDCFVEASGLTRFKKVSEIFTAVVISASLYPLWRQKHRFSAKVLKLLIGSVAFSVCAKVSFIFYVDVYGLSNLIGHYLMIIAVFFMYQAVVKTGIAEPTELLFKTLKDRELELVTASSALQAATKYLEKTVEIRTRELEQANSQLRAEIDERKQAQGLLTQKNMELEKSNRQLDDFACVVSHDLREQNRGIYHYSRILMQDYGPKLDAEGRALLERIAAQSEHQEQQIQALIQYSRIDQDQAVDTLTDLNALIKEVLAEMQPVIDQAGAQIRCPQPLPTIKCHPHLIALVFRNLISNALKYNDKSDKWVEIGCAVKDGFPEFYVKDNGIGIDERHFKEIFKMFRRLHGPGEFGGGIGAGLMIVRKIIEHHHGIIRLTSTPDQGVTFYFTLTEQKA